MGKGELTCHENMFLAGTVLTNCGSSIKIPLAAGAITSRITPTTFLFHRARHERLDV